MSELKAYTYDDMLDGNADVDIEYYPKSEADKVIADLEESHKKEVEQLLMDIVELKKEKEYVIEHTADVINGQEQEIRHNKRKRCLALARIANDDFHLSNQFYQMGRKEFEKKKCERYSRHHFKWLALADKFK